MYLESLDLYQLLEPVHDVDVVGVVVVGDVARVQPAVFLDGGRSGLGIIKITLHDLREMEGLVVWDAQRTRIEYNWVLVNAV